MRPQEITIHEVVRRIVTRWQRQRPWRAELLRRGEVNEEYPRIVLLRLRRRSLGGGHVPQHRQRLGSHGVAFRRRAEVLRGNAEVEVGQGLQDACLLGRRQEQGAGALEVRLAAVRAGEQRQEVLGLAPVEEKHALRLPHRLADGALEVPEGLLQQPLRLRDPLRAGLGADEDRRFEPEVVCVHDLVQSLEKRCVAHGVEALSTRQPRQRLCQRRLQWILRGVLRQTLEGVPEVLHCCVVVPQLLIDDAASEAHAGLAHAPVIRALGPERGGQVLLGLQRVVGKEHRHAKLVEVRHVRRLPRPLEEQLQVRLPLPRLQALHDALLDFLQQVRRAPILHALADFIGPCNGGGPGASE
mmetsp:Transcript_112352/g.358681  ORF Transcript_112352/g.358681 Transcript_112352/m.358681 type:complete len:356 (+) Transcript_112352:924-1991(+)